MQQNDKVITYDPTIVPACNLFQWCLIKEIRQARDKEGEMRQIAEVLFGDLLAGAENNRAWIESARNTFIAVLRVIVDCYPDNTSNWDLINALRNMSVNNLLAYLAKHPRNHSLLNKDFSYDPNKSEAYTPTRRATDIMFFFNSVLEIFGGAFESKGQDTIHDYLFGAPGYGRNLFLVHDLATAESSRPFILYFLKKIKDEKMSLSSTIIEPMLWSMDEADKLSDSGKAADFGIFQAATLGREYGLQILLTTQSIENLYGLAPGFNEHIARGGLSGFPVLLSFRPGDATTISTLQTLFGSRRHDITTMPLSRYDHPTVKSEIEPVVSEADFAQLDTGEAYIKIKSAPPQKVSFILEEC
jgi:type IV secretory pathway TraG/TraD family ATPase VirD4